MAGSCLPFVLVCLIVVGTLVGGRSLRTRHGRHPRPLDYSELVESGRLASSRLYEEARGVPSSYSTPGRTRYDAASFLGANHVARRAKTYGERDFAATKFGASSSRRKRHNRHNVDGNVSYRTATDEDRRDFLLSKQRERQPTWFDDDIYATNDERRRFELEVKEAQNSSVCNYTVKTVPDTRGSRVPRDLEDVKCNHAGSSCNDAGAYCCIQTYRMIEVSYGDGTREIVKNYVGCVCANRMVRLMESSRIPTED